MQENPPAKSANAGEIVSATGAIILRYEFESDNQVLHVEWRHGPVVDDVKLGFLTVARLLAENRCPFVLSDSKYSVGDWSELIPWVRYEFLPLVISSGVRYLVDVLPIDPANSFSVHSWHEQTRGVLQHKIFTSLASARAWIAATRHAEDGP